MKKFISLILLLLPCRFFAQVNLDSGLVACYPLNGHAWDLINGINGTVGWSQVVNNQYQVANSALQLFGTTNSYIELPAHSLLKANALSFSAWIRPTYNTTSSHFVLFTRSNAAATASNDIAAYAVSIETINAVKKLKVIKRSATQTYTLASVASLTNNVWQHLCVTCDGAQMAVYLNGVLSGTLSAPGNFDYQTGKKVYLGGSNELTAANPYTGMLDNLRFYDRVLSPPEVSLLYQNDPACVVATQAPIALFSLGANCAGQTMHLTDSSLHHADTWHWNISGITLTNPFSPGQSISVNNPGPLTVTLIVNNNLGADTLVKTIQVYPQVSLTAVSSRTYICRGETYVLTASASGQPTYTWNGSIVSPTFSTYHAFSGTYIQTVTSCDTLGCRDTALYYAKILTCHTLSTGPDLEADQTIRLFPNPTSRYLHIESPSSGLQMVKLYNSLGRLIWEGKTEKQLTLMIDLSDEQAGVYVLQLYDQGEMVTRKVVKTD